MIDLKIRGADLRRCARCQLLHDRLGRRKSGGGDLGDLGDLGASGFPPIETVAGWGGDHYVVYRSGGQSCLRVDWRMDTAGALAQLETELRTWATGDPAVRVERPDDAVVRATRCGAA